MAMKEIIDDLKREGFTLKDWVLAFIAVIAFVLLTGIAGALE